MKCLLHEAPSKHTDGAAVASNKDYTDFWFGRSRVERREETAIARACLL